MHQVKDREMYKAIKFFKTPEGDKLTPGDELPEDLSDEVIRSYLNNGMVEKVDEAKAAEEAKAEKAKAAKAAKEAAKK